MQMDDRDADIAVVGMSCRLPGARSVSEYWSNLCAGVESISHFSEEELLEAGISPETLRSPSYVRSYGAIPDAFAFDAAFFGVNPSEAMVMDPQHRVFLECAWSALEDAGYDPARFPGAVGVFGGSGGNAYQARVLENRELVADVGQEMVSFANGRDFLTTRVSYKLGLRGPSVVVQTACSTSLVAVHLACQSLLNRECDLALSGGVTIFPEQGKGYHHQEGGILSPDGHCRAFDARAAGTVGGSGAGVVVLKRMTDALRDGDTVHAVIRGSAINNDGSDKIGFTAPSVKGQSQAIAEALAVADVDPSTVSYVEAHGTGTALGDPIEIEALTEVFRMSTDRRGFCALGAVKTNIGHVDSAAGVAGLIKTVLALRHRVMPPTLHFETPNPDTGLEDSPFFVVAALREWPANGTPRRAGVSSFGMGGTNAHVVLEEAPELPATPDTGAPQLLVLSAKTEAALERMRADLAEHLASRPELSLADAAHTLQEGRAEHRHRWAAAARDADEARAALAGTSARNPSARRAADRTPVAFLFPGQGTQYPGMARELYEGEPVFRRELDRCAAVLRGLGLELLPALFPAPGGEDEAGALLGQTRYTQPALFAVEYALAQLWMSWGVKPEAMLGHSIGEYVAACVAGVFTPEAALRLVEARGRLMQGLPGGSMLAVPLPEPEVRPLLGERVSLAAVNSAAHCVVSGDGEGIDRVEALLSERGVAARRLHTSHAFHSAAMDPILEQFAAEVRRARPAAPTIPFLSNVTGDWITAGQATDPGYWVRHLRETVRFADGVGRLLDRADLALLEVGPGETLGTFARRHGGSGAARVVAGSLARAGQPEPADLTVLEAAGALWTAGVALDWAALRRGEARRRVQLPTYPFDRTVYRVPQPRRAAPLPAPAAAEPRAPAPEHLTAPRHAEPMLQSMGTEAAPDTRAPSPLAAAVAEIFARLLGRDAASLDPDRTFLELGADSLLLMQASRNIEGTFGAKVAFRQLLDGLATLPELTAHLDRHATRRPEPAAAAPQPAPAAAAPAPSAAADHAARLAAGVADIFARLLGRDAASLSPDATFLELGADSLLLMQASRNLESTFGVKVAFRQLLDGLSTVRTLAAHLEREVPAPAEPPAPPAAAAPAPEVRAPAPAAPAAPAPAAATVPAPAALPAAVGSAVQDIVAQQLAIMQAQLELLRGAGQPAAAAVEPAHPAPAPPAAPAAPAPPVAAAPRAPAAPAAPAPPPAPAAELPSHGPHRPVAQTMGLGGGYTERQARHFAELVERYTARTRGSKAYAAGNRPFLADNRASLNFRMANKELLYPVVGERSDGSRMWDVDGNEYIDFTIGFGVHFFGHRPPFVVQAVEEQLRRGFHLGPQSDLAGPVAKLFSELTGMERVTFCNTGSEAIMTALRIARTVTGRDRVVMFDGSYHGCFDGILARRAGGSDDEPQSRPVAPGTPQGMIDDVVVLQYGTPEALAYLRRHAGELAAVLVEPVQNRNPEFHPREFLREVRDLTRASGTVLVWDEMITGLRLEPGGAQGFYGIDADLATYGKVIGGGFPLGVVAGRAEMMDAVDGGMWNFGDDSYPPANQTFFAGTFCKHPVTMAAAYAVLRHLKERGQALYDELNARTARLVEALRRVIDEEEVPMYMLHCASLFHFRAKKQKNNFIDLLFYHMLERGIYIWEGRACFLSTAHTDEDCDRLVRAFRESIGELRRGGFLPDRPGPGGGGGGGASPSGDAPASGPAGAGLTAAPSADAAPSPGVHASPDGARSFPLTSAQRLIWVHAQLGDDASRAYNEQIVLGLRGRLDAEALRAAVADLVEHHEALRTVFDPSGELQHVLPSLPVPLAVHGDAAAGPDRDALREAMAEAVRGVFDLAAGPLFRVHVHLQGPEHHVVQLVVHHLVADALGAAVLTRDLETALAARREGRAPALPRAMQFGEYAALLAAHVAAHAGREAEWLAQFEGAAPLALPYDRPRPQFPTSRGGSHTLTLREPLTSRVREFGRKHGCTLFMTLLGGLMATLHRLSDQDDVVVGIPSAGRGFPGSEGMVGHCVDVLPVRSRMGAGRQVREYMRDVRGWLLGAYDDEVFSYARLQEMLRVPRGPALPPLIPVVFNLEPVPQGSGQKRERTFAGMRVEGVGAPKPLPKFDLSIDALDRGGEIDLICLYNADLFDAETVERILGLLERLLDGFAARPEERVAEVELLDAAERSRVLDEWNRTARPWPRGVGLNELFAAQVAARPDAPALVWGDVELTYAELDARANRLAHVLRGLGVGPDARVGVMLERGVELVVSILAVIKAGGAYVPLDPGYPAERLRLMLEDSGVRVLLTRSELAGTPELAGAFGADGLAVVRLDEAADALASQPAEPVRGGADPENLAYIVYTSGSTGRPKGVMVAHRHVVQLVVETDYVRFAPGDRVAQASNASFDALTFEAWGALLNGATLVGIPRDVLLSPPAFREALRAQGITTLYQTTALLNQLSREQPDIFAPLREVLFGGQAADADSVRRLLKAGKPRRLLHMYGPTETTAWCSYENVENVEEDALTVSVGRGTGNQRIYLLDSALNPVSVGLAGEAFVGGDGVVRGYLDRPALTAERFLPDPFAAEPGARMYRTGDRLRWTVQGKLEFVGRVDEQVKVRGFRIEPGEIEAVLCAHEGVSEARVIVREDEPGEQRMVAYVVGGADADALREHLRRSLPEYMVPAAFVALEQLPLTPNGKLDVRSLPAPDFGADGRHVAPRTPAEEVLAGIWAEVLKLERVGRHDHFFELGGHSLLATRMISRVREVFRVELPVRAVFEGPTVAELAEQVEALRRAEAPVLPPVAPVDRSGALPLSFAQERLWFLDRLQPGSSFYNIPVARRLGGALDRDALERALGEIVRRHEALRTVFHEREGAPVQVVAPFDGFTLATEDLSGLDDAEREEEVRRQVAESGARPFDLAEGPLFRAKLLRLDEEDHVLLLRMHHIVADGWSIGVLFGEMWTLYWAFREGGESPLRELPVQYGDFAVWQREQLQGEAMERQLAWWRERLAGAPALLELPADRARPAVQSYRGAYERVAFSGELLERLDALGRSEGATLYMVLLGAFQVLLGRYARSEDVVVGSPIAGRTRSETEGLIGFFVNTLVLRTDLSGDPAFREVLRRVREMVLGAYEHQDLPFEKLVEELQPERSLSHSPLFQAMFSLDNTARSRSGLTGMRVGGVEQESEVAKFDLTLSLVAHADGISGGMEYSTDLFERSTIERMLGHLERVLEQVAARPEAPVSELVLPGDAERRRVLQEWNATAEALPGGEALLHELVEAQVRRTPDAVAVVFEGSSLTYAQLDARANRLVHHLVERGVGPDTRVAVCAGRSLELVVGLLAVLKAGGAYVPLDPAYPAGRLRSMLEDGAPALLLTQAPLAGLFAGTELPVVELDDAAAAWTRGPESPPRRAAAGPGPDHLAYMIFTSGSTGRPKGAMNAHRGIVNRLLWMQREYGLGAADAVLQKTPFSFDVSVWEFFWPLIAGARLVVARPEGHRDPRYLAELIGREGVTTLHFVPPMLQLFLEETDAGCCATVRRVVCSGEALPQELQDRFFARFPGAELHNLYGPTEAAVDVTFHACRAGEPVAIGRPVANTRVYVLDAAGEPAPIGVPGELYIGGVQVGRGYLGRPELTAERFVPDAFGDRPGARLYRTGDLARWRPEGTVEFLGRVDFQVKVRGFRIEPGEIEARLAEHPDVREAVVLAQGAGSGDRRLVAYYVAAEAVEVEALRTHLSERLPEYMVPTAFVRLDSLPLTPNGKLDRRALPSPAGDAYATRAYEAPVGEIEEALAGIWSQVLGVERVGRRDHFFELGGHSLRAVQVVSRVRQLLHVEAALGEIFLRPVLADFARGLDPEARAELPPIEPADRGAPLPVSFAQRRLWFVDRMGGTGAAYHISTRLRLRGELDRGALVRALDTIVARHEALRTTFVQVDAEPAQRIAPVAESAFRLLDHDLAGLGEAAAEAELLRLMAEETGAPFDLERGPLIRGRLARLGPDDHALLVTMHHIVSDGWSMGVFMDELSALYTAFHRGDEDPLPPLPVQYADYAAWQRRWLDGDVLGQQADFWKRTLAGAPEQLELPTDHARPAQQDFAGAAVRVELDEELTAGLKALSRRHGATLFMTVLAGWAATLGRLAGQDDVVVGTPAANRGRSEVEGLIGFFINTLALRVDLSGQATVADLLAQVKAGVLAAQQHQDIPFEQVVELVQPARSLARNPLFQVALAWQNTPRGSLELPGLTFGSAGSAPHVTSQFDMSLTLLEAGGWIVGNLTYATALLRQETVERWIGYLRSVLREMVEDERRPVSGLAMLDAAERALVVDEWNRTARPWPRGVGMNELFEAQVAARPDAPALAWGDEELSYRELDARANRLAHHLRGLGVGPDARVGVMLERGVELVVSILAVIKAGGAYVPLDPGYPAERLRLMLEDSGVRVLLTRSELAGTPELAGAFDADELTVVHLDRSADALASQPAGPVRSGADPENLAYIVYTSGSTGRPKGVMVAHRHVVQLVVETDYVRFAPGDRVAQASNASFDALTFEAWGALLNGATLVGIPRDVLLSPAAFRDTLREQGITTLYQTTALLNQLSREQPDIFAPLREVLFGGQAADADSVRRLLKAGKPRRLLHMYGPTETTAWCSYENVEHVADDALTVSVGRGTGNQRIYLLDGALNPVPVGVAGEAFVGGDGVVRGYLDRPELTSERFVPDPFAAEPGARMYRTGDRLRWTAEGKLEFVGRVDEQVKVRGFRIEPGEIEAVLCAHEGVSEARVIVREDEPGEQRLVAYVVGEADADAMREHLRRSLPEYMVPAAFVALEQLPLTPNGKLDVRALPAPELGAAEERYVAPRTPVEEVLAEIWAGVLGVERVGAHDDFFELGGHSLLIMRLLAEIQAVFGLGLSIRTVFSMPTVEAMALEVERLVYEDIAAMPEVQAEQLVELIPAAGE